MTVRIALSLLAGLLVVIRLATPTDPGGQAGWLRAFAGVAVLLVSLSSPTPQTLAYQFAISAGLCLFVIADLFHILAEESYLAWYGGFVLGLLALLVGVTGDLRGVMPVWLGVPVLGASLFGYARLANGFGRRRLWQLALVIVISFVVWTACGRAMRVPEPKTVAAGGGAVLLYASTWAATIDRFKPSINIGPRSIMLVYVVAVLLLAWSV